MRRKGTGGQKRQKKYFAFFALPSLFASPLTASRSPDQSHLRGSRYTSTYAAPRVTNGFEKGLSLSIARSSGSGLRQLRVRRRDESNGRRGARSAGRE